MNGSSIWCNKCESYLSFEKFYYKKNGKRDALCKECRAKYYRANKDRILFANYRIKRKSLIDEIVIPLKSQGCVDCHENFNPEAMDLDHVKGAKQFSISQLATLAVPDEVMITLLQEELKLCEVCCANCHRKRTILRYKSSSRIDYINKNWSSKRLNEKIIYAYDVLSSKGCIDCGLKDLLVLEFDHVRLHKTVAVSKMFRKSQYDLSHVKEEISKCDVRCVICHRIKTLGRALEDKSLNKGKVRKSGEGICACGENKDSSAAQCSKCYQRSRFQSDKYPTLNEIILGVENYGWQPYAKTLGLSDNGLRKIAKKLGANPLPRKKR